MTRKPKVPLPVPNAERLDVIRRLCEIAVPGCFADVETRELLSLVDAQAALITRLRARVKVEPDDAAWLDPHRVEAHLLEIGWGNRIEARRGDLTTMVLLEKRGRDVRIPQLTDAPDFAGIMATLVNAVAKVEGQPPLDVLDAMAGAEIQP
jgi:hypothetical protein